MEEKDQESDLQALRKLYGLLQSNRNDSQCACSESMLDEKAKGFLKNLLDGATKSVLEAHSMFKSAQVGVFDASPAATDLDKLKAMPISRPTLPSDLSIISPGVAQSTAKALKVKPAPSGEIEKTPIKFPKCFTSATKPESRKRCCTAADQSYVMQTKFIDDKKSMDIVNLQHQQANQSGSYWGKRQVKGIEEIEKKPDETHHNTSKEVADALKEVEFCFPSLHLAPEHGGPLWKSEALHGSSRRMASSIPGMDSVTLANAIGKKSGSTVQVTSQSVKASSRIMEWMRPLAGGQNDHHTPTSDVHESAQGLMLPPSPMNTTVNVASALPSAISHRELIRSIGTSQSSKQQVSSLGSMGLTNKRLGVADSVHKLSGTKATDATSREKGSLNQVISRSKLLPQKHSQCMRRDQDNGGVQNSSSKRVAQRKILLLRQESGATSLSSSWTTEEASRSNTRSQGDMGSTSSSDCEGYSSLPGQTEEGSSYMGPTSSSSESKEYPFTEDRVPAHHHINVSSRVVSPASSSVGSAKDYSSRNWPVKLERRHRGGFRRLKDKLALVFHHHHHHHHHHHGGGDDTKAGHGKSLWKNAGKIFNRKSKHEGYGEPAVKEGRKSVVCKVVADKNQHGHFRNLVKGLLGQIQKSKQKVSKGGGMKRLGGSRGRGGKKVAKKLHWWKMFRHHQKAGKSRRKPYGNLGFGKKNPKFKALPKIR